MKSVEYSTVERFLSVIKRINLGLVIAVFVVIVSHGLLAANTYAAASAADGVSATEAVVDTSEEMTPHKYKAMGYAFLAAAFATGLGSIGAGIAVSNVGSAAMGAVAEKPELMGKSLIYVALAEGIAIYGLLISIVILAKV